MCRLSPLVAVHGQRTGDDDPAGASSNTTLSGAAIAQLAVERFNTMRTALGVEKGDRNERLRFSSRHDLRERTVS